jgi:hypothetical protein
MGPVERVVDYAHTQRRYRIIIIVSHRVSLLKISNSLASEIVRIRCAAFHEIGDVCF